jgi:hypothetical protein
MRDRSIHHLALHYFSSTISGLRQIRGVVRTAEVFANIAELHVRRIFTAATEISDCPFAERSKRYRYLALNAHREAQRSLGPTRDSCLMAAVQWERLAFEAEARRQSSRP